MTCHMYMYRVHDDQQRCYLLAYLAYQVHTSVVSWHVRESCILPTLSKKPLFNYQKQLQFRMSRQHTTDSS